MCPEGWQLFHCDFVDPRERRVHVAVTDRLPVGDGDRDREATDRVARQSFAAIVVRLRVIGRARRGSESTSAEFVNLSVPRTLEIDHIEALLVAPAEDDALPEVGLIQREVAEGWAAPCPPADLAHVHIPAVGSRQVPYVPKVMHKRPRERISNELAHPPNSPGRHPRIQRWSPRPGSPLNSCTGTRCRRDYARGVGGPETSPVQLPPCG